MLKGQKYWVVRFAWVLREELCLNGKKKVG